MSLRLRALVASLLLLATLGGGAACGAVAEVSSELKAQMRATHEEMLQHDLWSAYEYGLWAKAQGVELPSAFLDGYICGDPGFATPNEVSSIKDCGELIQVVTRARWHCFAPDGHPITSSFPLGLTPGRVAYGFGTTALGAIMVNGPNGDNIGAWKLRTYGLPAGNVILETDNLEKGATFSDCSVAADGSAFTMTCYSQQLGRSWLLTATAANNHIEVDDLYNPIGVGPNGAWVLAHRREGEWDRPCLILNDKDITPLQAAAAGPGIGAILTPDGQCQLVNKNGSFTPLILPVNIGKNATMATVGRYLVIGSGTGAKSADDTDIMGQPMAIPPDQPETLACFQWKDLLADPQNAKWRCYTGPLAVDLDQPAGLFLWKDRTLSRLDLSTATPRLRPFSTMAQHITWAWTSHYWTVVNQGDALSSIINDQGQELWSGEGQVDVQNPQTAVIRVGNDNNPICHIVHLSTDPKLRTDGVVEATRNADILCPPFNDQVLVTQNDVAGHWHMVGFDGKMLPISGVKEKGEYAPLLNAAASDGRFYSVYGRTFLKAAKDPSIDKMLWPRDAYTVDNNMLVLTWQGHVLRYTGGEHGMQVIDMGVADHGTRFGLDHQIPVVIDGGKMIRARFDSDSLVPEEQRSWGDDVGPGLMQVQNGRFNSFNFIPPGLTQCTWTDQQIGFNPLQLRSCPDDPGLVVVTYSLVVWLPHDLLSIFETKNR